MKKILAVAEFTVRKVEEPAFLILLAFGLLCGYMVSEMDPFTIGKEYLQIGAFAARSEEALPLLGGFVIAMVFSLLICGFYGATDIPREIESGIIMILLGKPISRTQYLAGKYLGIVAISMLFFLLSSTALIVGHFVKTGNFFQLDILLRQMTLILLVFPFTAINLAISCFLPDLSAMIVGAIYIIFCFFAGLIPVALSIIPEGAGIDLWLQMIYYFFPNFLLLLLPMKIPGLVFVCTIFYAAAISLCFLIIGSGRMEAKDIL